MGGGPSDQSAWRPKGVSATVSTITEIMKCPGAGPSCVTHSLGWNGDVLGRGRDGSVQLGRGLGPNLLRPTTCFNQTTGAFLLPGLGHRKKGLRAQLRWEGEHFWRGWRTEFDHRLRVFLQPLQKGPRYAPGSDRRAGW